MSDNPISFTTNDDVRPEFQRAVDAFEIADAELKVLQQAFEDGSILYKCLPADDMEKLIQNYNAAMEDLKKKLEDRNAKLQAAQNALRSSIMPTQTQWRGPDGKATMMKYGRFEVSSKTSRSFVPDTLFKLVQQKGMFTRLLEEHAFDKKSGESRPIIRQRWDMDYEQVKNFLRENNMEEVIIAAYDEDEMTPAVQGPRPIAFLGDTKK
jgi:hypothetical protein